MVRIPAPVPIAQPDPLAARHALGRNLAFGLADALGRAIVTGAHTPRTVLTEAELAIHYAVSRTVTREALKMLTAKGLVSARPRRGTLVEPERSWNLFDTDVLAWMLGREGPLELLRCFSQLRCAMEPGAAALAATNARPKDRIRIYEALTSMRAGDAGSDESVDADIAFHVAILDASGNPFFAQFRDVVATALRTSIRLTSRATRKPYEANLADHGRVWEAIDARDPAAARASMRVLVADVLDDIAEVTDCFPAARAKNRS